jgi:lipoprotein-anchoring transpeptidase ErfK/SrfK
MHLYGVVAAVAALAAQPAAPPPATELVRPAAGSVAVHEAPGGAVAAAVGAETEFGSPLQYALIERRGEWLGVITPAVPNGRIGWVRASSVRRARFVRERIDVDLSRRLLRVIGGGGVGARFRVSIGAPGSPTPTGRFAITDKFPGEELGTVYGCCVLVLSGHQPRPPQGWTPDDYRLAIHGGEEQTIGTAASAGCLHARPAALRFLMARIPLGTRVTIHP